MRKYPEENWRRLGEWVSDLRLRRPDYRDMEKFAEAVGRSTRQLRDLERGRPVGVGTLEQVARALGVESSYLFERLADPDTKRPLILTFDGTRAERAHGAPESPAAVIRRSIHGDPDEHSEFDDWMATVNLRLQVLEQAAGVTSRAPLDEQSLIRLRNSIAHSSFTPGVESAALRVFVDYAADQARAPIEIDTRAQLLYAYAASGEAPAYLADELMRRFGDFDPDVDPSAPRTDLAHPMEGEVTVSLSDPAPGSTAGGSPLRPGRRR